MIYRSPGDRIDHVATGTAAGAAASRLAHGCSGRAGAADADVSTRVLLRAAHHTSSMSAAPRDPMAEEHAVSVRCEALGGGGIVQYACRVAGAEGDGDTQGAPDAPLRAAMTELQRAGALAGVSEDGGHIDVVVRQRDEKRVKKKLARTLPSLRWDGGDKEPTSVSRMSNCVEEALRFALITEAGWLPVQFRGSKWLVRAHQEGAPPTLERPTGGAAPLLDVVSFKFRAVRAGSEEGVLLCKAYVTKMWQPKDIIRCLPRECQAHMAEHGSVDLTQFIQDDSHDQEVIQALTVAALPRLSRGVITGVSMELPPDCEHDEDWYRQHWLDQYSISLPETLGVRTQAIPPHLDFQGDC